MATFFFAKKFSRGDSPGLRCGHFQTVLCSGLTSLGRGGPAILAWPTFAMAVQQLKPIRLFLAVEVEQIVTKPALAVAVQQFWHGRLLPWQSSN